MNNNLKDNRAFLCDQPTSAHPEAGKRPQSHMHI